jgi:hypothetical protein
MKNFLEKNFAKIMSTMILVAMFGYTMFVFNNVHKELLRIDRNVQELVSDVYKRKESATDLFMDQTYNYESH